MRVFDGYELVEIIGLVGHKKPHIWYDSGRWSCTITLAAWRDVGGGLVDGELTLTYRGSTRHNARCVMNMLEAKSIVRLGVTRISRATDVSSCATARLHEISGRVQDLDLQKIAEGLRVPTSYHDPVLGVFTLDRELDSYWKELDYWGTSIRVYLEVSADYEPAPESLAIARAVLMNPDEWRARWEDYAMKHIYPDDDWFDEDVEWDRETFLAEPLLTSINCMTEGGFDLYFDSRRLFADHRLVVSVELEQGFETHHIWG